MKDKTFSKQQLTRIKTAKTLLEKAIFDSCSNNRDTQMLMNAIETIKKVIEYNLLEEQKEQK